MFLKAKAKLFKFVNKKNSTKQSEKVITFSDQKVTP